MAKNAFGSSKVVQIGIVVEDIEDTAKQWAAVLGVPVPAAVMTDSVDKANTRYRGEATPARAKLAFFDLGQVSLELIEPVGGPSTWKEHLDNRGEGVHHIAFVVPDTVEETTFLESKGMPLAQKGDYTGGRYAYIDAQDKLGVVLELLQNMK